MIYFFFFFFFQKRKIIEMAVPEVNKKLLEQLEDMGFPRVRATRALHYSGA
jgi:uncharacterized UBP type Zn finger protein